MHEPTGASLAGTSLWELPLPNALFQADGQNPDPKYPGRNYRNYGRYVTMRKHPSAVCFLSDSALSSLDTLETSLTEMPSHG